jgi:hypothetical protein
MNVVWDSATFSGGWNVYHTKCPNCGYCTCCKKADYPGAITVQVHSEVAGGRSMDSPDVQPGGESSG